MRRLRIALVALGLLVIAAVPSLESSWRYRRELRDGPDWDELELGDAAHFETFNLAVFPPEDIERELEAYTERPDLFPRERLDANIVSYRTWTSFFNIKAGPSEQTKQAGLSTSATGRDCRFAAVSRSPR